MLTPQTVLNLHTTNKDDVFRRQGELFALFKELAKQHGETEELMLLGLVVKVACELSCFVAEPIIEYTMQR